MNVVNYVAIVCIFITTRAATTLFNNVIRSYVCIVIIATYIASYA